MNNQIINFLTARNSKWSLASGILVLLLLVLGCSDSGETSTETAKKPTPPAYVGTWTGQDGSTVTLRNDGSGDYKSGGKSVSGAAVEIDETAKEIRFALLGFDSGKYKIDQAPAGNKMKLDGMEYRRTSGFDPTSSDTTTKGATDAVPSESELRPVVTETVTDFNAAVESGDFSDFYGNSSETWQSQTTAAEMTSAFQSLFKQKLNFKPKDEAALNFVQKPAFEANDVLKIEVGYPTVKGTNVKFRLRYVKEGDKWKLLGIVLNPDN